MSVNQTIEWFAVVLILFGSIISVISAFGMIRLPDVYTRSHAATKSATLSVLCCLLGAFIYFWFHDGFVSIRLILGIIFVFITAPVAGHLVCRAAYRSRVPLAEGSGADALKPVLFGDEVRNLKEKEVLDASAEMPVDESTKK
ncbi:Na+/H+ antiporter subunit G [Solibacillus sp. FSL H8-0538]|uniref:Na+/H+ antiporter subunit G n=1 Tax=Solibacillus sp. FSL H8-0538 TaxID=2921400 RepID=UPI0030FA2654